MIVEFLAIFIAIILLVALVLLYKMYRTLKTTLDALNLLTSGENNVVFEASQEN